MTIVDTHAHVYHPDENRYPMIDQPSRPPDGTGTVEHLEENRDEAGVSKAVLVQTGSAYRWDNSLLADASRESAAWAVGVCTLDPEAASSVDTLSDLATNHNVRGLRMEPPRRDGASFYHDGSVRLWEAAGKLDVVINAHIRVEQLDALAAFLDRFPSVNVVLDHAAYPTAADGPESDLVRQVNELSRFDQLNVKLSFVVTGSEESYPFSDMHDTTHALIEAYGPSRCVWGSDFPCEHWLKKSTYAQHLDVFQEELGLSDDAQRGILEETPTRLWFGR